MAKKNHPLIHEWRFKLGNKYIEQNCPKCNELTRWRVVERYSGKTTKDHPHTPLIRRVSKCRKCQFKNIEKGRTRTGRTHIITR